MKSRLYFSEFGIKFAFYSDFGFYKYIRRLCDLVKESKDEIRVKRIQSNYKFRFVIEYSGIKLEIIVPRKRGTTYSFTFNNLSIRKIRVSEAHLERLKTYLNDMYLYNRNKN